MKLITRHSIVLTFSLLVLVCLTGGFPQRADSAQDASKKLPVSVEGIFLSGKSNQPELTVKLSSPTTYTSYKTSAPLRLIVDLSQTTPGVISAPVVFNKGNFKSVTANRYDTDAGVMTRLDIELFKDGDAILSVSPENPGEIKISFPAVVSQSETGSSVSAPLSVTPQTQPATTTPQGEGIAKPEPVVDRILKSLKVKDNSIVLTIENGAGEIKTMRLNKPDRFVVDLFDVKNGLAEKLIPINSAGIASARIGMYPEKLRIVFDGVNGGFLNAAALKSAEGAVVTLNGTSSTVKDGSPQNPPTAPVKVASQPSEPTKRSVSELAEPAVQEKSSDSNPAKQQKKLEAVSVKQPGIPSVSAGVEMIDFQIVDGISRVSVKIVGDVSVGVPEQSSGFVTLPIKNANLPKPLQRSLETKAFNSPVLRITPLLVKTNKGHDTKIRIALRAAVPHSFHREGDMLYVDFKNPATNGKNSPDLRELQPEALSKNTKVPAKLDSDLGNVLAAEPVKLVELGKTYKGRKVSLEFADAEVRKIFQLLSEVSNKNFVLGDDVTGTISIKLVNVPWDQALDIILDTKGLDKREDGNIIIIKGKGKFKSQAEEEQEVKKALTRSIELKTETFSVNYADTVGIAAQFASLKTDRGTIAQDVRTNKVIVKDIPQALDDMRRLLSQLDVPEKQVMIEARIVEATSTFSRNLGVNWGVHFRDAAASFLGINSLDTGFGGLTSAPPTSGTGTTAGGNMGISFGTLGSNVQLDMRLNAAASAGLIKIVSTPKVATLNNKTAKITQGQQIPYTSSTSDKVETKFIEAALSLEVTPHINANGTIGMKIDAKNDSPGAGGNPPPINKKQATTEMLLRDGETTVIGGIYVDSDTEADDGVPFLMDVPLLGKLFKTNNKSKTKTELLIFITPRILGSI
ncbi:type IV pilus secretin family protein [Pelotalea chapellei]|uniref:Type IV pilus secretin PilQ n=1 Tax=Pelotalea chapellei TaxID=44671 RepID=A0ABS5U470_9BACT|nr:type IV pilus secretin family protein [Pelotalea chapellei]MBT1070447.1 type IV pilus secretin PilQ [Pelotalea chapellei]